MLDSFWQYLLCRRTADLVFAYVDKDKGRWIFDSRCDDPDPSLRQTTSGLFLQLGFIAPVSLWTPWGHWRFAKGGGGYAWEQVLPEILGELGAVLYRPGYKPRGLRGAVYGLHIIDGNMLPDPVERHGGRRRRPGETLYYWRMHTKRYQSEHV